MWFHLLSVATFLALGSCLDYYGHLRKEGSWDCQGLGCSCYCPDKFCAPCPIPEPIECFSGCGTPTCPCVSPSENQRSDSAQLGLGNNDKVDLAQALSTVNVKPTGPVCTAVNLRKNIMLTISSCVAGIAVEDLYVTVVTDKLESLKVINIKTNPFDKKQPSPVLLLTTEPSKNPTTLVLPARPIDMTRTAEIQKFQVVLKGTVYAPVRTKVKSYTKCKTADLICAETYNSTVMGWNDIGSALVELRDNINWLQGMYMGDNMYNATTTIKYIPLYKYEEWLYSAIAKYS